MMFPQSGSGSIHIDSVYPNTDPVLPIPSHLCPTSQEDTQYQLFNAFEQTGDCYCEVSLGEQGQIDLVWVESGENEGYERIVGIEIKTESGLSDPTHEIEKQVSKYRETTVDDLTKANYIAGEVNKKADEVYVFDEVWVVVVGDHDRWSLPWRDDTPETGWLKYDPHKGRIEYEIDRTPERNTTLLNYEQYAGEKQLTATLWSRYHSPDTLVAAESWFTKPSDRKIVDDRVKYASGKGHQEKTKRADLVIGKKDDVIPLTENSTIRGLEIKNSFDANTRSKLDDQLPLYRDSKMFSEVYLVTPSKFKQAATEFLESRYPKTGLLVFNQSEYTVSTSRKAEKLGLRKVPTRQCPGTSLGFQL